MKFGVGSTLLTHVLAVILGIGIWSIYRSVSSDHRNSERPQTVQSSKADSPAQAEVMRRLKAYRDEIEKREKEADQSEASSTDVEKDSRPAYEQILDYRGKSIAEDQAKLKELLIRAKEFEKYSDLQIPLKSVLLQKEHSDDEVAIFLEWHRRDPAKAFDELCSRSEWCGRVLNSDALMLFLKPEEIINQLSARNRSSDFREKLTSRLGIFIAYTDDFEGLNDYFKKLDTISAHHLASEFSRIGWIPKDPVKALEFAANRMDPKLREEIGSRIAYDHFYSDSNRADAERFVTPFLNRFIDADELAEVKGRAEEMSRSAPKNLGCGGGDMYEIEGLEENQAMQKLLDANTSDSLDQAMGILLMREKDYPELFFSDQISGEEIFIEVSKTMKNHQYGENEIRHAIYRQLAVWNPKAAVSWASGYLSSEELQSVSMDYDVTDSRALNLLSLMEFLPSKYADGCYHGNLPCSLYRQLQSWREMDPKAVELALSRSPETIAISEKLKNRPKYSFESEPSPEDAPSE